MDLPFETYDMLYELFLKNSQFVDHNKSFLTIFEDEVEDCFGKILHHVFGLGLLSFRVGFHYFFTNLFILLKTTTLVLDEFLLICVVGDDIVLSLLHFPLFPIVLTTAFNGGSWSTVVKIVHGSVTSHRHILCTSRTTSWAREFLPEFLVELVLFGK